MNIYVGNLSWSMSDEDLQNLFAPYGNVSSARILRDKMNGRSKGFGFVEMESNEEALAAINGLNQTDVGGRNIIVNESQPRPEGSRPPRREGGGGGYRGGNNRGGGGGGYRGGGRDY